MSGTPAKKTAAAAKTQSLDSILGNEENTTVEPGVKAEGMNDVEEGPADLPIGPDSDKEDVLVKVDDQTSTPEEFDRDEDYHEDETSDPFMSPEVVHMASNKTPAELAAETPDETAERYNIDTRISEKDANNPRVQVYRDTLVNQVPSGTHLHPDVAKDLMNRGIAEMHTDNAQVKRVITDTYDFAPDAETNDKF